MISRSAQRIAASIFVGLVMVGIGVIVLRWRGRAIAPVATQPVLATNAAPSGSAQATDVPTALAVQAQPGQRDGRGQAADGKVGRPLETQYGEKGRLGPLQLMRDFLGLSDEQAKKLEPVLKEWQNKLNALRRNTAVSRQERVAKLKEIQDATDEKIHVVLTPEQAEKWRKARLNRWQPAQEQGQGAARTNQFSTGPQAPEAEQGLPKGQSDARQPQQPRQATQQGVPK